MFADNLRMTIGAPRWLGLTRVGWLAMVAAVLTQVSAFAAPPNNMPIWRLQVRFVTATHSDAGTDDDVKVELNSSNRTWIDSGRDDREPGQMEIYDLRLDGITTLADIDFLRIEKNGDDAWAIDRMWLVVNGVDIYDQSFPGFLWLDNDGGHVRFHLETDAFMQSRAMWANYSVPGRANIVPIADFRSRLEAVVGDFTTQDHIIDDARDWNGLMLTDLGSGAVELFTKFSDTWRVDLDMEADSGFFNGDIDADFDLKIQCSNGLPRFSPTDINVTGFWETDALDALQFITFDLSGRLNDVMKGYKFAPCPDIGLAANGDLHFSPKFPPVGDLYDGLYDDSSSPLEFAILAGIWTKSFEPVNFVAKLKSKLPKDAKSDIAFELPAQVYVIDTVVEVRTSDPRRGKGPGKGDYRTINAKLKTRSDGSSVLMFGDNVLAGRNTEYTIHVRAQTNYEGQAQIVTSAKLDVGTQQLVTAPQSITYLTFKNGDVFSGTLNRPSSYVLEAPKPDTLKR